MSNRFHMSNSGRKATPEELRKQAEAQRVLDASLRRKPTPGIPQSALDGGAPVEQEPTQMSELDALLVARRGELVNLPVFGAAYMAIVPHPVMNEIEAALFQEMARLGLPPLPDFTTTTYELERKARILDAAARKATDPTHATPLLPSGAWAGGKVDDDLIVACFEVYRDVRTRLDPVGAGGLDDVDMAAIGEAFKKKDATSLARFGAVKLALWLVTTDALQLSSPTPASSPGI
jgi:hypothetical protein